MTIVADKEKPGRDHANQVAELLDGIAASVRIVEAAVGKDPSDQIAVGLSLDELVTVEARRHHPWPRPAKKSPNAARRATSASANSGLLAFVNSWAETTPPTWQRSWS
jgi:hypothetical protein